MTSPRRHRVTRDFNDPAFPHGQDRGYGRGCRCPRCRAAHVRHNKRHTVTGHTMRPASEIRPKLQQLHAAAGGNTTAMARAIGVGAKALTGLLNGRTQQVQAKTYEKIMRAEIPSDVVSLVPRQPYTDKIRQLQANGHSLRSLAAALGYAGTWPCFMRPSKRDHITTTVANAVDDLYRRLENTPGDDERAKAQARAKGYYPPAHYNDDGTLNLRSIPGHPWARMDDRCAKSLQIAIALLANPDVGRAAVATEVGVSERQVTRMAKTMNLPAGADDQQRAAARSRYAQTLHDWQYDDLDTVHAAFRIGLINTLGARGAVNPTTVALQEQHPGYQAWLREVAERAQAESYVVAA